jgi:uncharacterized coiled-coil protein SlyX
VIDGLDKLITEQQDFINKWWKKLDEYSALRPSERRDEALEEMKRLGRKTKKVTDKLKKMATGRS